MRVREVQSGCCYVLFSVKNPRLVFDLSGADWHSILGYEFHDSCNQKWLFHQDGTGWTMRSLLTAGYAGPDGYRSQKDYLDGTKVIGSSQPSRWQISKENDAELSGNPGVPAKFRVSLLDARKSLHLPYHRGPGAPNIEICDNSQDERQLWYINRVAFVRDLQSGYRYKLTNVKQFHRALDLSGGDNHTVIGFQSHEDGNQRWDLYQDRGGSMLRCVHSGGYLLPQGYHPWKRNYPNGTQVVASQQEFRWSCMKENEAELTNNSHVPAKFRLSVPKSRKCLDLADYGKGCNAEIWDQSEDGSQLWYFELIS